MRRQVALVLVLSALVSLALFSLSATSEPHRVLENPSPSLAAQAAECGICLPTVASTPLAIDLRISSVSNTIVGAAGSCDASCETVIGCYFSGAITIITTQSLSFVGSAKEGAVSVPHNWGPTTTLGLGTTTLQGVPPRWTLDIPVSAAVSCNRAISLDLQVVGAAGPFWNITVGCSSCGGA